MPTSEVAYFSSNISVLFRFRRFQTTPRLTLGAISPHICKCYQISRFEQDVSLTKPSQPVQLRLERSCKPATRRPVWQTVARSVSEDSGIQPPASLRQLRTWRRKQRSTVLGQEASPITCSQERVGPQQCVPISSPYLNVLD
jgi:hypothetical protein